MEDVRSADTAGRRQAEVVGIAASYLWPNDVLRAEMLRLAEAGRLDAGGLSEWCRELHAQLRDSAPGTVGVTAGVLDDALMILGATSVLDSGGWEQLVNWIAGRLAAGDT